VRTLLERALEEGRSKGFRRAQISCLIGNDAAQRAYERAGFEVVEERRSEAFERLIGAPGFSRMTRKLAED
jgi:RimJ/RimL family protein N-acetyltransferase